MFNSAFGGLQSAIRFSSSKDGTFLSKQAKVQTDEGEKKEKEEKVRVQIICIALIIYNLVHHPGEGRQG